MRLSMIWYSKAGNRDQVSRTPPVSGYVWSRVLREEINSSSLLIAPIKAKQIKGQIFERLGFEELL